MKKQEKLEALEHLPPGQVFSFGMSKPKPGDEDTFKFAFETKDLKSEDHGQENEMRLIKISLEFVMALKTYEKLHLEIIKRALEIEKIIKEALD